MSLPINRIEPVTMMRVLSRSVVEIKKLKWRSVKSGLDFQKKVTAIVVSAARENGVEAFPQGEHGFPDIVIGQYGVEIKYTKDDKWTSTGNSIVESTRTPGVERVFLLFGKGGGSPDVLVRPYEDCLDEIVVTHSPRYRINMKLEPGKTIFDKMGTTYVEFNRSSRPIQKVREYYKTVFDPSQGRQLWWLDETEGVSPSVVTLESLPPNQRASILTECMVLFPELFSEGLRTKYNRAALHITAAHQVTSHRFRDYFSASGMCRNPIGTGKVHRVWMNLYEWARTVDDQFNRIRDRADLVTSWSQFIPKVVSEIDVLRNPQEAWMKIIDSVTTPMPDGTRLSHMYVKGLKKAVMWAEPRKMDL